MAVRRHSTSNTPYR